MGYNQNISIYKNAYETSLNLGRYLGEVAESTPEGCRRSVALSGGSTPKIMFSLLKTILRGYHWERLEIFFTDERIVPIESFESNYGEFYRLSGMNDEDMFNVYPSITPDEYRDIERIYNNSVHISELDIVNRIRGSVEFKDGLPSFDIMVLGIGDDGHTASIFGDNLRSFESRDIVEIVTNPNNGSKRISLTGSVINNTKEIIFLCTGKHKSSVVESVYTHSDMGYPASHVAPVETLKWFLDDEAATLLKIKI